MVSPLSTVNNLSTTDGVDVSGGSTITIRLADTAGVNLWVVSCVGTDELHSPATITASLVKVSPFVYTAEMPVDDGYGFALIFQSQVNSGKDINNRINDSFTTTFGVYEFVEANGLRVGATGETVEGSATYGYVTKLNPTIRGAFNPEVSTGVFSHIEVGSAPVATAGTIRLTSADSIQARNNSNSANVNLISKNASDQITIGDATNATATFITSGGSVAILNPNLVVSTTLVKAGVPLAGQGTTASGGDIRLQSSTSIQARNAADSANINLISKDSSNDIHLGDSTNAASFYIDGGASFTYITSNGGKALIQMDTGSNVIVGDNTTSTSTSIRGASVNMSASGGVNVISCASGNVKIADGGDISTIVMDAANSITITNASTNMIAMNSGNHITIGEANASTIDLTSDGAISLTANSDDINIFTGTGNFNLNAANITVAAAQTSFNLIQANKTTNSGTGAAWTIQAQNETGTTSTGGSLILKSGTGTSVNGNVQVKSGTGANIFLDSDTVTMRSGASATAATWTLSSAGANTLQWATGASSILINQADRTTSSGTGSTLTLQGQNETGTTSTGGSVVVQSGTGTTAAGTVTLATGATVRLRANNNGLGFYTATPIAQQTRITNYTDSTGGTPGTTLAALTGTYATDVATLRVWGASLNKLCNDIKNQLSAGNSGIGITT